MKIRFTKRVLVDTDAKYLDCWIGARYAEDAEINGEDDTEDAERLNEFLPMCCVDLKDAPKTIAHHIDDETLVHIKINLDSGKVEGWPMGITAGFHYKSCDVNLFKLLDKDNNVLFEHDDIEYVIGPGFMNEYGDYFVMSVNSDGTIVGYDKDEMDYEIRQWIKFHTEED